MKALHVIGLFTTVLCHLALAQNGPYQHQVHSATSADGLTWTRDGGGFRANVSGAAGQRFELQSSTNLIHWRTEGFRNFPSDAAAIAVSVPLPPGEAKLFLRTRSP